MGELGGEPPLALSCYEDHSMARPTGRTEAGILRWPEWPPPGDRDAKHLARYTSGVAGSWEGHTDIIPPDGGFVAFRVPLSRYFKFQPEQMYVLGGMVRVRGNDKKAFWVPFKPIEFKIRKVD